MSNHLSDHGATIPPTTEFGVSDIDCIYEIYNENAKFVRATMSGIGYQIHDFLTNPRTIQRHLSGVKDYSSYRALPLPTPRRLAGGLIDALASRRSEARYGAPLQADELATLLHHALAVNHHKVPTQLPHLTLRLKPFASGGGLYPVEFYLLTPRVDGVDAAVSHYDSRNGGLRVIRDGLPLTTLNRIMTSPFGEGQEPAAVLFMTGVFQRATNKYGNKGYKFAMIEAGAAGHTVQLVATSMGLKTTFWNAFYDDEVERLLGIDGVTESVITAVLIGK